MQPEQMTEDERLAYVSGVVRKLKLRFPVAELTQKMGVSKSNVSAILKGTKGISDNFLQTFISVFDPNKREFHRNTLTHSANLINVNPKIVQQNEDLLTQNDLTLNDIGPPGDYREKYLEQRGQVALLKEMLKDKNTIAHVDPKRFEELTGMVQGIRQVLSKLAVGETYGSIQEVIKALGIQDDSPGLERKEGTQKSVGR